MLKIGVIGGGSAGYLTALALRVRCPGVNVTLIQSGQIPPIGVGEGTTPIMPLFLHSYLQLDIEEFINTVQPTWKLGVQLDWGTRCGEPFQFPFTAPYLIDSYVRTGNINQSGLAARLMHQLAGLHMVNPDLTIRSLIHLVPFAYHLDNQRFVLYLEQVIRKAGVCMIDAHLVDHLLSPDGSLASVIADDGRQFTFDLFIDCTGFRSALLGGALEVEFKSYESSLFTNAALVGSSTHQGQLAPFTRADTLDTGWCWSVPQMEEDRRGYVFSMEHTSIDIAEAEMRSHCPGLGDLRLIHFRPGRRMSWWTNNVIAIGNAYGFVEPLQATALHMIVHEITVLVQLIKSEQRLDTPNENVNHHIASIWDGASALLALHYRYNNRRDSPFWREANGCTNLGVLTPFIDEAIQVGSLTSLVDNGKADLNYGLCRDVDFLLLGLQLVEKHNLKSQLKDDTWCRVQRYIQKLANQTLAATPSLHIARDQPSTMNLSRANWIPPMLERLENPLATDSELSLSLAL